MLSETRSFLQNPYEFCTRHGRDPFFAKVFGVKTLFISDPVLAHQVLNIPDSILSGSAGNRAVANALFGTSVLYADGNWHKMLRHAMKELFAPRTELTESISSRQATRVGDLMGTSRMSSHRFFRVLSLCVTAEYFLDSVIDPKEADGLALDVDLLGKGLYATDISSNPNSRFGKAVQARLRLDDFLEHRIGEKFSRPLQDAGLDKRAILDQAVTMLFAGVDTSSVAMTYAAELLTERVREGGNVSRPIIIAAVRSALLKFPPVYFIPRGVLANVELSNIEVKRGWFVNIMICALHDQAYEGHKSAGYIPFGLGEKRCPGEVFAMRSTAAMLERLFSDYKVELSGGREGLEFMPGLRPKSSKVISLMPIRH